MTTFPQFISGPDLANLVVNAGLLQLSCGAIKDLHAETNRNPEFSLSRSRAFLSLNPCAPKAILPSPFMALR
ncbi:hypothetical protein OIU78_027154 [Salix suchowensis]|nr:hypothetical protein OIU78_027154 [Salix suchowensis]